MQPDAPTAPAPHVPVPASSRASSLRQWLKARLEPPRRLSFTREGKYFVGITFGVGFAAINTGNNLLYLLLGMLLSLIVASGLLSEMSLRRLRVERQPPQRIFAGQPFLMSIGLANGKRRLPSFSIEVEDFVAGHALDKKCYFLKLPPGRLQSTSYRHTLPRRGRYVFSGFRLSTRFPFTLFRKSRLVTAATEVLVLPRLVPIPRPPTPRAITQGDESLAVLGRRGEFHGLREFRDGDDPRDIHWRSTARRGRTIVREHEDDTRHRVSLFLDNALPGGEACTDERAREGFERAVSLVASYAAHFLETGYAVRLVTRGTAVAWVRGPTGLLPVLRALALVEAAPEGTPYSGRPDGLAEPIVVGPAAA